MGIRQNRFLFPIVPSIIRLMARQFAYYYQISSLRIMATD